jgi:hypothetical protein
LNFDWLDFFGEVDVFDVLGGEGGLEDGEKEGDGLALTAGVVDGVGEAAPTGPASPANCCGGLAQPVVSATPAAATRTMIVRCIFLVLHVVRSSVARRSRALEHS